VRKLEFRLRVHETTFRPLLQLYIGGREFPLFLTEELLYDMKAIMGLDPADEIFEIYKCEINAAMLDIEFGLTLEELSRIGKLIKEKLK